MYFIVLKLKSIYVNDFKISAKTAIYAMLSRVINKAFKQKKFQVQQTILYNYKYYQYTNKSG